MASIEPAITGKVCLVLEDEFLIALDIQQILESAAAARVICFGTTSECVAALEHGDHVDLAILDFKLGAGDVDSLSVAAVLHERGIPFMFVTGMRRRDLRAHQYLNAPVVEKPYEIAVLLDAVRRAISGG